MSDKKLLPCPFCGGEARFSTEDGNWINCKSCGAETDYFEQREEAIKAWNTRVPMQKIVERLEKNIINNVDCYTGEPCNNPCVDCMNTTFYKALEIVTEEGGLCD